MADKLLTFAEFAKRVSISRPRIYQLVDEGRLPVVVLGPHKRRIPFTAGMAAWDAYRGETTVSTDGAPVSAPSPASTAAAQAEDEAASVVTVADRMARAKADDKAYQAETRRLKLEELRGSLIPASEVRAEAEACATRVRSALSSLPSRLALRLEGRTAPEIEAMLSDEIGAALRQLGGDR